MKTLGQLGRHLCSFGLGLLLVQEGLSQGPASSMDLDPIGMPSPGANTLRVLSPNLLELVVINTKGLDPARVTMWDFINSSGQLTLPAASKFVVTADGQNIPVLSVGFKRRVLYAPLNVRDLRIANSVYLTLGSSIADNQTVEVRNPDATVWPSSMSFVDIADPYRWNPAIHVNQVGYMPGFSKKAMVGYFLGSMGEMNLAAGVPFRIVDINTRAVAYQGTLTARPDQGFTSTPLQYQKVLEADFTTFNTPGRYWLVVPGLGASYPFWINDGIAAAGARSYMLGMYHQRCGGDNSLPFTRHTHGACHTAQALVPPATEITWQILAGETANINPRQTAPRLQSYATQLYPFVRQGLIDVSGGHHDAGDYSKYTIDSALLIHALVFAADNFPDAGALDNLGIPESGDGKSDLLQEAKWEADYLAKMQDTDGGFYFLVYPRYRAYEGDVLPDQGDSQVVWPKTTSVSAASTAVLAQIASSPLFKQQFPAEAALYMQKAQLGWTFLENAIARYGKDGAYQRITHYGDEFIHDDELAWAAAEMFAATGNPYYQQKLMQWLPDPNDRFSTARWTWWRLFEGYGCAVRDYAFAVRSGRLQASQMDAAYLTKCENEIKTCGQETYDRSQRCAYGSSFADDYKRPMTGGWYFSMDQAFDLATAFQLNPDPAYVNAVIANMNYEMGCNSINMNFITGVGWKRWRDIVSQYAQNDRRVLPPSGLVTGNITTGFQFLDKYKTGAGGNELNALSFPPDSGVNGSYWLYDRWGDSFNVTTELVVQNQARSIAAASFLMARTGLKTQSWRSAAGQITGLPAQGTTGQAVTAGLSVAGMALTDADVVWEARDLQPEMGPSFNFAPVNSGSQWVEAEAMWPDGRRAFAATAFSVTTGTGTLPTVTVSSGDATASEVGPDIGSFTVTRTGSTAAALSVSYSLSGSAANGTDYASLPGIVTIPAGAASATVLVTPVTDTLTEGTESVVLSVTPTASYQVGSPNSATVQIADSSSSSVPLVNIVATDALGSEVGPDNAVLTVGRSGSTTSALTVNYTVGGTAGNGSDYQALSGSVTIPAGSSTANIVIAPIVDSNLEALETVIVTLSTSSSYDVGLPASATASIDDLPVAPLPTVTMTPSDPNASEVGPDTGTFTVSRTGSTAAALTVSYSLTGTASNGGDYQSLSGSVTIPAGSASAGVVVNPFPDSISTEGTETVNASLVADSAYQIGAPNGGTISIADGPVTGPLPYVNVASYDKTATEGTDNASFTVMRPSESTSSPLTVNLNWGGTALNGLDYQALPATVTIPVGLNAVTINVVAVSDALAEGAETVTCSAVAGSGYQLGNPSSDTVTINDGVSVPNRPSVSVSATDPAAAELNLDPGMFTFTRTGSTIAPLTVRFLVSGSATLGTDYQSIPFSVTIPAGAASTSLNIVPKSDSSSEANETVVVTLSSDPGYTFGDPTSATVTIADNVPSGTAMVTIATITGSGGSTPVGMKAFKFSRTGKTRSSLTVKVSLGGTAVNGVDYNTIPTSITIPKGYSSVKVNIVPKTSETKRVDCDVVKLSAYGVTEPGTASATLP